MVQSTASVTEQLVDIVVRVLGCQPSDVVPAADLKKDLGADSLTIVEIGEELGRRFDVYLTDETIDGLTTVESAVNAVVRHDGSGPRRGDHRPVPKNFVAAPYTAPADAGAETERTPSGSLTHTDSHLLTGPVEPEVAEKRALSAIKWLAVVGIVVGGIIGLGTSALVGASGIDEVSLPPLPTTAAPQPTATQSSPTPTPTPTETYDPTPEPTLTTENARVAPGERFVLTGRLPDVGEGAKLQVQVREPGTGWDDFPVEVTTRDGGEFKTELWTSRTGEREFRLIHEQTGATTPTVEVTIG